MQENAKDVRRDLKAIKNTCARKVQLEEPIGQRLGTRMATSSLLKPLGESVRGGTVPRSVFQWTSSSTGDADALDAVFAFGLSDRLAVPMSPSHC